MNKFPLHRSLLAAAVGAVLVFGAVSQVNAQSAADRAAERRAQREQNKGGKSSGKVENQYPNATRKSPDTKASSKAGPKLKKMMDLYDGEKHPEARAIADEIIATDSFNNYDRAFASQIGAQIAYDADDANAAIAYLKKAVQFDGLDNNSHFGAMLMEAQLEMQEEKYAESLASFDRFFNESKSDKPEHLALKGNVLYRLERYPEAITVLKQAIAATPEPKNDWVQVLMAAYADNDQPAEAAKLAEGLASKNPGDKRTQLNLASTYLQAEQFDKAVAVLEKLRASGQFTEDRDYRSLYTAYLQLDGKEKEAATVINEGLQKGVLKPDYQAYLALAQSYYFSDQAALSIDAYKKAAPLSPDGETYLNLARVLWAEDRIPEAKDAAKQAIAKGVKKPDDAKKIIALPGK